ncbi:MAG: DUF2298 domain-containing protein [Halanaeroarchaeum sp.]
MEFGRVVVWWILFQALLLAGWPLAAAVAPTSRDRGAWLAIPLAIVTLLLPVFWLGHWTFGVWTVLAGVVVLLAGSAATAWWRGFEYDWREVREVVAVFTIAFLFLVSMRAAAAGIYPGGGEKFLDFGLLKSLLRAEYLPPADMWFAGERVLYYYGGHLVAAVLAELTATPGRFAYSLALSGFYAMEVTAIYGLASSIAADRSVSPIAAGSMAAFMWGFASNLLTPARLLANLLPTGIRAQIAAVVAARRGGIYYIDLSRVAITPETFSYWTASRIIPGTINEFPLFAFRNGDLHAHMTSVAFMLTAVGVLYGYYRTPEGRRWRRRALVFGVLPPIAGVILFTNTWSFPTVLGLAVLSIAAAPSSPVTLVPGLGDRLRAGDGGLDRVRAELQRPVVALVLAAVVGAVAVLWVAPFVGGILVQGAGNRGIGFMPDRTGIVPFVLVHGAFLTVFGLYLGGRLSKRTRGVVGLAAAVPVLVVLGWRFDLVALALVGPLVLAGWILVRRSRLGYDGVLVVAGAGLVVLVEFVFLVDNAAPTRFNTVFKVYAQVWTFWAIASGVAMAALAARTPTSLPVSPGTRSAVGQAFVAVLLVTVSLYGAMAMANHYGSAQHWTLDGYEYLHEHHPDEAAAIEWIDDLEGQPTLASAPGYTPYTWENPASSLTGVPTVAGWAHEGIYRGGETYRRRGQDVEIIFETTEARSRAVLLRRYEVEYLYYGPREKQRYGIHDYASEPGISVAFSRPSSNVTIYRIDRDALVGSRS